VTENDPDMSAQAETELGLVCYGCLQPHQVRLTWEPTGVEVGCLVCGSIGRMRSRFDFQVPSGVTPVMHYDSIRGVIQGWLKEHEPDPVQRLAQIAYADLKRDFRALEERFKPIMDRQEALEVAVEAFAHEAHERAHGHLGGSFRDCYMGRCKKAKEILSDGHVRT
jgi:hypothetical protein